MSDLLIRNIDCKTKRALVARAARNGRSQQAEARAIIESALDEDACDWVSLLRNAAALSDGIEIEVPARHAARVLDTEGWL